MIIDENQLSSAHNSLSTSKLKTQTTKTIPSPTTIDPQNLIGVLRWIVELGRIDIAYKVSSLARFLAQPRTGHIYRALHIFKYLEAHIDNDISFDPLYQEI